MRKLHSLLTAVMMGSLSLTFVACSDDDNNDSGSETAGITLSVSSEVKANGLETDVHSAILKLPVTCNGGWVAYLNDDNVDWVAIEDRVAIYEGNQTLRIRFDENRTGADRRTQLTLVTDNGDKTVVTLIQNQTWNGEIPENGSAQWFGDNGLGRGLNYEYMFETDSTVAHKQTFNPLAMTRTNPIFNWATIEELQNREVLTHDAYVEDVLETVSYDDLMRDSLVHGKDSIGMKFDLEIGFGFIEFEGHGAYSAKESKDAVKLNYLISRSATVYDVMVSPAELSLKANALGGETELSDEEFDKQLAKIEKQENNYKKQNQAKYRTKKGATEEQKDPDYLEPWQQEAIDKMYVNLGMPDYAGIFSKAFGQSYFRLTRAVQQGNEKSMEAAAQKIDDLWGPVFVGRAWYGGSINMRIDVDKDSIDVNGSFTGIIAGGVDNIFHIEGTIEYEEEATRYIRNSHALISVYGGTAVKTANELTAHFAQTAATNRNALLDILNRWGDSLKETKDDNGKTVPSKAAMQKMQLHGIWTLFEDEDAAMFLRNWMYAKHPSLHKYVGMILED